MCTLMYVLFVLGMSCGMEHILSRIVTVAVLLGMFSQSHNSRSMFGSYPLRVYISPNHTITVYRFALYIYITHTKRTSQCVCTLQEFGWHSQQSYHRFNITLPDHINITGTSATRVFARLQHGALCIMCINK